MEDPVKKQYEAMHMANAAFRKEFGAEINKAIPLYEDPTRYPVDRLIELFKFQHGFRSAQTQAGKDALKKEFAARRDAIAPLPNAPERIYLWKEGNMPTQTDYTENPDHLYDHEPDFRPYYLEMTLPSGQKPLAGIVLVAGGTHGAGTINECYEIGLEFNALGYSCFILQCRPNLGPWSRLETAVHVRLACCFALCEFLIFYYNVCCVNSLTIFVRITSGLNTTCNDHLKTLAEILLCELCASAECYASDEVCCLFTVIISSESSVNCKCVSCNCR